MNVTSYRNPESWIESVLKESYNDHGHMRYFPDGIYNESNRWGFVLGDYAYMGNLNQSNYDTISAHMLKRYPRQTQIIAPVFKVTGLWVMLLTKQGKPTQAALHLYDILYALENRYPVYDSDDLNDREYAEQISSIESTLCNHLHADVPDNYAIQVFSWLWDNDQESIITEDHAYVSDSGSFLAALTLGYLDYDPTDPDDIPIPNYVLREFDQWVTSAFNRPNRF